MRLRGLALLGLLLAAAVVSAVQPDWYYADVETARGLSTKKLFYLEQKAGLCPTPRDEPESLNVRMVGKWGGGPSWGVTGRDTLVYLSRGSEVVVINFADTANPLILNYIQARRLAGRPVLQGNRLYLATSGYIEVFDITDPLNAPRIGRLATPVSDIDVEDTLVYAIGADSFKVFDFADPQNPRLLGACRDSGYALDCDRGYAYLCDRWGMYILDARNPASPHRIASWGTDIAGVKVRGNHCYVAQGSMGSNSLHALNVANPASPWEEGRLSGLSGEDIYLVDTLAFLPGFDVVNVADSSRPRLVAHEDAGGYEVWVHSLQRYAVTAGWTGGLRLLNLDDIRNPALDTTMLGMFAAADISVKGGIGCVASQQNYMILFDVGDPAHPREVGRYVGRGGGWEAVLNLESLAYVPAAPAGETVLHVVDITDPAHPQHVGSAGGWEGPSAMVLRDSFLYAAEPYRFEVFSVANPRQPVSMGICNLPEASADVVVRDTLAYVACLPSPIIRISDPSRPTIIGNIGSEAQGIAVFDTFAYLAVNYGGLKVWSVANPRNPYRLDTIAYTRGYEVDVRESLLLYGGLDYRVLDLSQPRHPPEVGYYATPYRVRRVATDSSLIYCACSMAGIVVLENLPTGIAEVPFSAAPTAWVRARPNPTARDCEVVLGRGHVDAAGLYDVAGKSVRAELRVTNRVDGTRVVRLRTSGLSPGAYFLRLGTGKQQEVIKIIKQ